MLCSFAEQGDVCLSGDVFLAAKAPTHQGCDDTHLLRFHTQGGGGLIAVQVWNLAANVDRCLVMQGRFTTCCLGVVSPAKVGWVVAGGYTDGALGLQEHMFGGRCPVGPVDDDICLGETAGDITFSDLDVFQQIAVRTAFVYKCCTGP